MENISESGLTFGKNTSHHPRKIHFERADMTPNRLSELLDARNLISISERILAENLPAETPLLEGVLLVIRTALEKLDHASKQMQD